MDTTVKFKTNIKCGGCIATVTPFLNETVGEGHWQVDIQDPNKILTADTSAATATEIKQSIEKAGYKAELLN
jgi:copper chaperone CopZ